jgi:tripartite-type tricarboxylate transporter receptor subunit TctC
METFPKVDAIGKRYPVATVVGWQAIFAPTATPPGVISKLRNEWQRALSSPELQKTIRDAGFEPARGTVEDFSKAITADFEKFGRIIKDNKIQLD